MEIPAILALKTEQTCPQLGLTLISARDIQKKLFQYPYWNRYDCSRNESNRFEQMFYTRSKTRFLCKFLLKLLAMLLLPDRDSIFVLYVCVCVDFLP